MSSNTYYSNSRPEMLELIPADAFHILELGCGQGNFGAQLKQDNPQRVVIGIEYDSAASSNAKNKLNKVYQLDLNNLASSINEDNFDCLICNDILEHLIDPWSVLQNFQNKVRSGGTVILSIPNIRNHKVLRKLIFHGLWEYVDEGILDRTHLRFFTRKSIIQLAQHAGLSEIQVRGINASRFPRWLKIINFLSKGKFDDLRWQQFALIAKKS